jgi:hypothetical protein
MRALPLDSWLLRGRFFLLLRRGLMPGAIRTGAAVLRVIAMRAAMLRMIVMGGSLLLS